MSTDGRIFDGCSVCHHGNQMQYFLPFEKKAINKLIEQAILEAENEGARVLGLGALNKVSRFFRPFLLILSLRLLVAKGFITNHGVGLGGARIFL